jgi:hypothetical protein
LSQSLENEAGDVMKVQNGRSTFTSDGNGRREDAALYGPSW